MDLHGKDKGNISLPQRLQPINFNETKLETVIVNTQKCFYDLKIAEINKRIQSLEERNRKLENNLEDMHYFIKTLQEEKTQEINSLKSQIASYITTINAYKHQLITLEKARNDDKYTHIAITINIDEKYKNTRITLISQIKLLSAKTNILEDYKSMQHILEKKLDMRNQFLINEKEQVAKNLYKIEYKFKIDRERFKKELYNHVLNLVSIFQVEILNHMPCSIPNLLSENIAVKNQLSMIMENAASKTQDYSLLSYNYLPLFVIPKKCFKWNLLSRGTSFDSHRSSLGRLQDFKNNEMNCNGVNKIHSCFKKNRNAAKEHKREIRNIHLRTTRSTVISELEKSIITMLRNIRKVANVNLSKLDKFNYFTEEQYMMNKDNARILADKCEIRLKNIELLLYCEKEKLNNAKNQKRWLSNQLQEQLQILYDVKHVLKQFKINDHEQQK